MPANINAPMALTIVIGHNCAGIGSLLYYNRCIYFFHFAGS
jgi:hypothetical protein